MTNIVRTSAHAKLLLFGEHAAVWGYPALGLSLTAGLTLEYEAFTPDNEVPTSQPWEFWPPEQSAPLPNLIEIFQKLRTNRGLAPLPSGRVRLASDIPPGGGWGSSAALASAFARLFLPDAPLEGPDSLDEAAREGEKLFHGRPSGIDTALALRQGWWYLERINDRLTAKALPDPNPPLVAGALPRLTTTKDLVNGIAEQRQRDPSGTAARLASLGELAQQAQLLVRSPRFTPGALGRLMQSAQAQLTELGVSHPALQCVFETARQRGSLGEKLSGAGGGGAFVLVFSDHDSAIAACGALQEEFPPQFWAAPPHLVVAAPHEPSSEISHEKL
ncbi:MAG: mevalonate kinase [Spirochaetales bacterium]|nr:mevalonate kinase [Spirochaetales bacterium]